MRTDDHEDAVAGLNLRGRYLNDLAAGHCHQAGAVLGAELARLGLAEAGHGDFETRSAHR